MIYDQVENSAASRTAPIFVELDRVVARLEALREAIPTEDSKSKTIQLQEEVKTLRQRQRHLNEQIEQIREDGFKVLLAEEYGLSRQHPKFENVYALAYQHGHSSGFSEVEGYFVDLVELVK